MPTTQFSLWLIYPTSEGKPFWILYQMPMKFENTLVWWQHSIWWEQTLILVLQRLFFCNIFGYFFFQFSIVSSHMSWIVGGDLLQIPRVLCLCSALFFVTLPMKTGCVNLHRLSTFFFQLRKTFICLWLSPLCALAWKFSPHGMLGPL